MWTDSQYTVKIDCRRCPVDMMIRAITDWNIAPLDTRKSFLIEEIRNTYICHLIVTAISAKYIFVIQFSKQNTFFCICISNMYTQTRSTPFILPICSSCSVFTYETVSIILGCILLFVLCVRVCGFVFFLVAFCSETLIHKLTRLKGNGRNVVCGVKIVILW